jgi:hypothetical protein
MIKLSSANAGLALRRIAAAIKLKGWICFIVRVRVGLLAVF